MGGSMIVVTGSVSAKPDTFDEVRRLSLEHVHRSRAEPGCISHAVHVDCENPSRLVFVEEWKDQPSLQTHFKVPASGQFVSALSALAVERPKMVVYEAEQLGGMPHAAHSVTT